MRELKFEELSLKQKLGMVMVGTINPIGYIDRHGTFEENLEFIFDLIRNHSLGAVWVPINTLKVCPNIINEIKEVADYPILIFTDAEGGLGEYTIGRHNALGVVDNEELAYTFGKMTAITARKMGYNVVCNPVVDMQNKWVACGGNLRSIGSDKHRVAALAKAEARGMHDGGVLTVAKHYPGAKDSMVDSHMTEISSDVTKEQLVEYHLYPYLELMKEGLMDGIMAGHAKCVNIDEHPASVSKKIKDIIRELGFEGFFISDALGMLGLVAKYGDSNVKGICVESGIDLALPFQSEKKSYADICNCFEKGIISKERLDEAVKKVLEAQHKVYEMQPEFDEITQEDVEKFNRINRDGIYARTDDGIETSVSRDGKHLFVLLAKNESDIADDGKVSVDTFTNGWWYPAEITKKLEELFPNSTVKAIYQFPTPDQNRAILMDSVYYDDVIMLTFAEAPAYAGSDHLTHRMVALINAMQISGTLSTVVHFGNPYPLEELSHIKRLIIGGISSGSVNAGLEVLAGEYPAKGVLTYDVNFQ